MKIEIIKERDEWNSIQREEKDERISSPTPVTELSKEEKIISVTPMCKRRFIYEINVGCLKVCI